MDLFQHLALKAGTLNLGALVYLRWCIFVEYSVIRYFVDCVYTGAFCRN